MTHSTSGSQGCDYDVNWGNGLTQSQELHHYSELSRGQKKKVPATQVMVSGEELEDSHSTEEVTIEKRYGWLGTIRMRGRRP